MKASEYLKRQERLKKNEEHPDEKRDHSLQAQAKERATEHPTDMHAGTAFDWEDVDDYQRELERLDREGPGTPRAPDAKH